MRSDCREGQQRRRPCACVGIEPDCSAPNHQKNDELYGSRPSLTKARATRSRRLIKRSIGPVGGMYQLTCRRQPFSTLTWGRRIQSQFLLNLAPGMRTMRQAQPRKQYFSGCPTQFHAVHQSLRMVINFGGFKMIKPYIRRDRLRYRCLGVTMIQPRLQHCVRPRIFHDSSYERPNTTTSDACEQGLRPMPPEQVESESVSAMVPKRIPEAALTHNSATHIGHAHCVRVRAPNALRPAGLRQRRPLQVISGRPQVQRSLHRSSCMIARPIVENEGARVRKATAMVLVHRYRHSHITVASTVAYMMSH